MKVFMIGESAKYRDTLLRFLPVGVEVLGLPREAASTDEYDRDISEDDVVVSLRYSRKIINPKKFRLLHVPGAGLDGIDFKSLPESVSVCNVYEHEIPIAEYVIAAMLDREVGFSRMCAAFTSEQWPDLYRSRSPHGELGGKTLGLIGYGRIGREVAKRAYAFGMNVIAANRSVIQEGHEFLAKSLLMDELDRLLAIADYVVVACPLAQTTRGLLDAARLKQMHRSAVLINVSRAEIIDQQALYDALKDGHIGAAVLDVWWHYPASDQDRPSPSSLPFDALPNVYCTPHSSAWTKYLPERRYQVIAQNIRRMMSGEPIVNLIKRPHRL
jgi:phosphoglycerate dehydrogenase-like enzyme